MQPICCMVSVLGPWARGPGRVAASMLASTWPGARGGPGARGRVMQPRAGAGGPGPGPGRGPGACGPGGWAWARAIVLDPV